MSRFSLWWKRYGLHRVPGENDERGHVVQAEAMRNGYVAAGAVALTFSAFREVWMGQPALFWPTAAIVVLPLLVPLAQRLISGGLAGDERVWHLQTRAFRWAGLLLIAGLFVYGLYRDGAYGDVDAMRYFYVAMQSGLLVLCLTPLRQNTIAVPYRSWLASGVVLLFSLVLVASPILLAPLTRPSAGTVVMSLLLSAIMVVSVIALILAAWRRRREAQEEAEDRRRASGPQ